MMVHGVSLVAAVSTFASFAWAIKFHFRVPVGGAAPMMRYLQWCGLMAVATNLAAIAIAQKVSSAASLTGVVLFFLSSLLFWGAVAATRKRGFSLAFSETAPEAVVMHGPYRYIRHPFYSSYILAWIAGAACSGQPLLLLFAILMGTFYHRAALLEERQFANSLVGDTYRIYLSDTGRFFPKLRLR